MKIYVYKPFGGTLGFLDVNNIFKSGGLFGSGRRIGYIEGDNIYSVETLFGSYKVGFVSGNYVYTSFGQLFGSKKVGHIVGRDVYDTSLKHVARMDEANLKLGAATLLLLL